MPDFRSLRHLLGGVIVIAALMLLSHGVAPRAEALSNCDVADTTFDAGEQAFLTEINNYRIANGRQPLTVSVNLNRAAEWMAFDLGHRAVFSHTDSLGRGAQERIADCGGWGWFGENLAAGTRLSSAQSVFSVWRASGGHNMNMLLADYKQIGIARYYAPGTRYVWYWATTFSVTEDGTSPTTGSEVFSPAPGTTIASTTADFGWQGVQADEFWLTVGTTYGGYDVYSASLGLAQSATVSTLPSSQTVYVRLWTRVGGLWHYTDYTYYVGAG